MKGEKVLLSVYRDMFARNAAFQQFETLKRNREKRAKQQLFFLEGVHPVEQAVAAGYEFHAIGCDAETRLSGWAQDMIRRANPEIVYRMAHALREELSDRENPCELVCLVRMRPELRAIDAPDALYTVFDRAITPGNLGTVVRSADAFGSRSVITTGHSADFYDPQCVRASIGTLFHVAHAALGSCDEAMRFFDSLPTRPLIVGTSAHGTVEIDRVDMTGPVALVVGNETFGLSKAWKERCDVLATIPIYGAASSLNVGCATTACLYEIARQRRARQAEKE